MDDDLLSRWIDERERHAWSGLVATVTRLPAALESHLQRQWGMGLFEYAVMGALSRQPDRTLQLKELARLTSGSLSRLSHVMNRLEQRGWVRRRSAGTGRATDAVLTELGHQKRAEATPGHMAEVRRLVFDVLTPEQIAALEEITERINAAIGAPLGSSSTD